MASFSGVKVAEEEKAKSSQDEEDVEDKGSYVNLHIGNVVDSASDGLDELESCTRTCQNRNAPDRKKI